MSVIHVGFPEFSLGKMLTKHFGKERERKGKEMENESKSSLIISMEALGETEHVLSLIRQNINI